MSRLLPGLFPAVLVLLLATSCSRSLSPTSPARIPAQASGEPLAVLTASPSAGWAGFYPLAVGSRWVYSRHVVAWIVPTQGPPGDSVEVQTTLEHTLTGLETWQGRTYVVEDDIETGQGPGLGMSVLYRQDRSGLYEAARIMPGASGSAEVAAASAARAAEGIDAALALRLAPQVAGPHQAAWQAAIARLQARRAVLRALFGAAARPGGGPLDGELTRLRYPLHPGASWEILHDPLVIATVEAADQLVLPAGRFHGQRIRIVWPQVFGPNDRAHVWYGRDGFLALEDHLESVAVDDNGNLVGTAVFSESQRLVSVSIAAH